MLRLLLYWCIAFIVRTVLVLVLTYLGVSQLYILFIIEFVLAFIFSFFIYLGDKKQALKDPAFHRNVAILFALFMLIDIIGALWK